MNTHAEPVIPEVEVKDPANLRGTKPPHKSYLARWHIQTLRPMLIVLIGITVLFFSGAAWQVYRLNFHAVPTDLYPVHTSINDLCKDVDQTVLFACNNLRAQASMATYERQRMYHQANMLANARITLQIFGFVTGMAIALIGASFVLGQLVVPSILEGTAAEGVHLKLETTSPGLILAVAGVVLMGMTLLTLEAVELDIPITNPPWTGAISGINPPDDPAPGDHQ